MKAIIVNKTRADFGGALDMPVIRVCADSAVGRDVMPLFVPDIPLGWRARVCPAFRISRLGKHIAARFAPRYVDGVTAACLLCADDPAFVTSGLASVIDSAVTIGRYAPWTPESAVFDIDCGGEVLRVDTDAIGLADAIASVSVLSTLKSGDLLIFPDTGVDVPLIPDTRIRADIGGTDCLRLKVK